MTAVSPAIIVGATYLVTVTTPAGLNATDNSTTAVFAYTLYVPTVLSVNPSSSSGLTGTGGSATITGTGFFSGTTVNFNPTTGTNCALSGVNPVTLGASQITVDPPTNLITSTNCAATYYLEVTTPAATSQDTSTAVFSYVPTVTSISPATGPRGTTLTINGPATGANFVSGGLQVTFIQETNGVPGNTSVSATTFNLRSVNQITAQVPSLTVGKTYYVVVTTLGGVSATSLPDIYTAS
jgi:hypothetical protein